MQQLNRNSVKAAGVNSVADKVRQLYEKNQSAYKESLQTYQREQSSRFDQAKMRGEKKR